MYQIEKNIPAPLIKKTGAQNKYPFSQMEVGDSFFVAGAKRISLTNAAKYHTRTKGWRFSAATVPGGARCWRVE